MSAPPQNFPAAKQPLDAPTDKGVYVIYNPEGDVLHVGRTPRARQGIRQRLRDHLATRSSFTLQYLDRDGSKLRTGYKFRCLCVESPRLRALLEAYAVG